MPGFTAENALYTSRESWRHATRHSQPRAVQLIQPQLYYEACLMGCYMRRDWCMSLVHGDPDMRAQCYSDYYTCQADCLRNNPPVSEPF